MSISSFNYHVRVAPDPAVEQARREQQAKDKKIAEEHKAKLAEAAVAKLEADKLAKAKKAEEDAHMHKVQLKANEAWNKYKTTKAYQKTDVEKTWKEKWIKENASKVK